jgi:hypothetical protein
MPQFVHFSVAVASAAMLATACASVPATTEIVSVAGGRPTSPRSERYASDVAAIADAFQSALKLPPVEVPLVLFPNRKSFAEGLVERGYTPELADTASSFDAIGGASAVLVNAQVVDRYDRRRRVQLLAHELVHSMQYVFGGGTRGASEQWLREGFADWVAARVVAQLKLASIDAIREEVLSPLSSLQAGTRITPLENLSTFPQWANAQRRTDGRLLYAQAFLGSEWLVEKHGTARMVRYFELFAAGTDRRQAFQESFGLTVEAFGEILESRWRQSILERQGR